MPPTEPKVTWIDTSPEDLVALYRAVVLQERTKPGANPNDVQAQHEAGLQAVWAEGYEHGMDEEAGLEREAKRPAFDAATNTPDSVPGPIAPRSASPSDTSG